MRMRVAFASLTLAAAFVVPVASAAEPVDPARLAEARAVIKAMELDKQLDQLVGVMGQELTKLFAQSGGIVGRNPRVTEIVVGESLAMSRDNAVRPGGIIDTMAQFYAERFSLDELHQIRVFHESPAGKRLQEVMPELTQRVIQQSMAATSTMMPGLCARVKLRLQEEKLPEAETFGCPAVST